MQAGGGQTCVYWTGQLAAGQEGSAEELRRLLGREGAEDNGEAAEAAEAAPLRLLAASGGAAQAALGRDMAVVLAGGRVSSVGEGRSGELGLGGARQAAELRQVALAGGGVALLRAAYAQVAAVTAAGQLFLWGLRREAAADGASLAGVQDGRPALQPLQLVLDVALGHRHVVALVRVADAGGGDVPPRTQVCTWGDNRELALGRRAPHYEEAWAWPEAVAELGGGGCARVVQVAAGRAHSLALRADGGVRAWGTLQQDDDELLQPHAVPLPAPAAAVACSHAACAALAVGASRLYVWGRGHAAARAVPLEAGLSSAALLVGALDAFALAEVGGHEVRLLDVSRGRASFKKPLLRPWRIGSRRRLHALSLGSKGCALVLSCKGLGTPLKDLATRESAHPAHVPAALMHCLAFVEERREEEGLFRLAGSGVEVAALEQLVDDGLLQDAVLEAFSGASVAAFLKRFLRQLPLPLLSLTQDTNKAPQSSNDRRAARGKRIGAATVSLPAMLRAVLGRTPVCHLALLRRLLEVVQAVRDAPGNLMDANSLSIVLSASFFGDLPETASPAAHLEASQLANRMARALLDQPLSHWDDFWPVSPP